MDTQRRTIHVNRTKHDVRNYSLFEKEEYPPDNGFKSMHTQCGTKRSRDEEP